MHRALLALALLGCTPGADDPTDTGVDPEDTGIGDTDEVEDTDSQDGEAPAAIRVTVGWTVLRPGDAAPLSAEVLDADGRPLTGLDVTYAVGDEAVARVEGEELRAEAPGTTTVTARLGELVSDPVEVVVAAPPALVDPELHVDAPYLLAHPGDEVPLPVDVRDESGLRTSPGALAVTVDDEAVAHFDGEHLVAGEPGTTWVRVGWRDADAPPVPLVVTEDDRTFALTRRSPDADVVLEAGATLVWDLGLVPVAGGFPEPTAAERVALLDDATDEVLSEAEVLFGEARLTLSVSDWEPGVYRVRGRAWRDGVAVDEAPWVIRVVDPDRSALDAVLLDDFADESRQGNIRIQPERIALHAAPDGIPWVSTIQGSHVGAGQFRDGGWVEPEPAHDFTRSRRISATVRWNAGRHTPNASVSGAAGLAVDAAGRPIVAYVVRDDIVREENHWRSIQVARWQGDGRASDRDGGWVLLNSDRPHEVYEPPPDRRSLPDGPMRDRQRDAWSPRVVVDPTTDEPVVVLLSQPPWGGDWRIEARRWTGAGWVDHAPPVSLDLVLPDIVHVDLDDGGTLTATVHGERDGAPATTRLILGEDGTSVAVEGLAWFAPAAGLAIVERGEDLLQARWDGNVLTPETGLDRDPFADVDRACLASGGGRVFAAWLEGPPDHQRLQAARWSAADQRFEPVDIPLSRQADGLVRAVRCTADEQGHGLLMWTERGDFDRYDFTDHRAFVVRIPPLSEDGA